MKVIDHIVHAVKSRHDSEKIFAKEGFHVFQGGKHENWGTSNSLSYLGSSYIELISIDDEKKAFESVNPLISHLIKNGAEEGVIQAALRTDNIEEDTKAFHKMGLKIEGPFEGSRITEEGELLSWKMLFVSSEESPFELPFLIEWSQPVHIRIEKLRNTGSIQDHPNGIEKITKVFYAIRNMASVSESWKRWFHSETIKTYTNENWNAVCTELKVGDATFVFFEPKGQGIIKELIDTKGEGPFGAGLYSNELADSLVISGGYYQLHR